MSYPCLVQGDSITVVIGNKPHTITKTHVSYVALRDAIKAKDWAAVNELVDPVKRILNYGSGNISIKGSEFFWKGLLWDNSLSRRMLAMLSEGFDIEPMANFMENLMQNPSHGSVERLYHFLENSNLPITSEGHFLCYKKVSYEYFDMHSSTVCSKPASLLSDEERGAYPIMGAGLRNEVTVSIINGETVVSVDRNRVDDNHDAHCSDGLHVCSESYLKSFGGDVILICRVNPRDVVTVTRDYSDSKVRTCKYTVVGELGVDPADAFTATVHDSANSQGSTETSAD